MILKNLTITSADYGDINAAFFITFIVEKVNGPNDGTASNVYSILFRGQSLSIEGFSEPACLALCTSAADIKTTQYD